MSRQRVLFITIDFHKEDEIKESFSVASIISYCQNKGIDWIVTRISINANSCVANQIREIRPQLIENDIVMFGLYSWSEKYAKLIIENKTINNVLCFGGYNVCRSNIKELEKKYPEVNHFIVGYAEESVYQLVTNINSNKVLNNGIDEKYLGGIYGNKILELNDSIRTIRFFTKLGCFYQCDYCAHRDVNKNLIVSIPLDKVKLDLALIKNYNIDKVNFIDPTFNLQENYLEITKYLVEICFPHLVSLQVSFNSISDDFLDLCEKLNCVLEFGVQDINEMITEKVNRRQKMETVNLVISKLNKRKIKHELSFIFGLPYQTIEHVEEDIKWVNEHIDPKICKIVFNRLMILQGTTLYNRKEEFLIIEEDFDGIPFVKETKWMNQQEMCKVLVRLKDLKYIVE